MYGCLYAVPLPPRTAPALSRRAHRASDAARGRVRVRKVPTFEGDELVPWLRLVTALGRCRARATALGAACGPGGPGLIGDGDLMAAELAELAAVVKETAGLVLPLMLAVCAAILLVRTCHFHLFAYNPCCRKHA